MGLATVKWVWDSAGGHFVGLVQPQMSMLNLGLSPLSRKHPASPAPSLRTLPYSPWLEGQSVTGTLAGTQFRPPVAQPMQINNDVAGSWGGVGGKPILLQHSPECSWAGPGDWTKIWVLWGTFPVCTPFGSLASGQKGLFKGLIFISVWGSKTLEGALTRRNQK